MTSGGVFAVSYGGGHIAALKPVFADWSVEIPLQVLGLTTAKSALEGTGIPNLGMGDLVHLVEGYEDALSVGRELVANEQLHPSISLEDTWAYFGIGYTDLVRTEGAAEARAQFNQFGRQIFRPVHFFERLYERYRPAVVVATSAPRAERAALEAARNLGVPRVCVVDLYAPFEIAWCGSPNYASTICVLNDAVADRFMKSGVPADHIAVTGNPAFDRLNDLDRNEARRRYRASHGLTDADRLLVWISQPEPALHPFSSQVGNIHLPVEIEESLADIAAPHSNWHLVARLHPSEHRGPAITGERIRYSAAPEALDLLLCAADCVVTCSSTVGIEANLIGVPVIQLMNSIFSRDLPLAEMGLATSCYSYYELAALLAECLKDDLLETNPQISPTLSFDAARRVKGEILRLL